MSQHRLPRTMGRSKGRWLSSQPARTLWPERRSERPASCSGCRPAAAVSMSRVCNKKPPSRRISSNSRHFLRLGEISHIARGCVKRFFMRC